MTSGFWTSGVLSVWGGRMVDGTSGTMANDGVVVRGRKTNVTTTAAAAATVATMGKLHTII